MTPQLLIRDVQMQAIADGMLLSWVSNFLRGSYPSDRRFGERGWSDEFVRRGVAAARARGITTPQVIRKYVHVNFLLGESFAADPDYEWAQEILEDRDSLWLERLERVEERLIQNLELRTADGAE